MFGLSRKQQRKPSARRRPPRRFRVESLESRDCLSAVTIGMQAQTADGHNVSVHGQVMGQESGYQITLSGQVSGSISLSSAGTFNFSGPASGLGTITGVVTDGDGDSAQASTAIYDTPPQVSSLWISATGQGKQVSVSGSVTAMSPGGLTVQFGGAVGLATSSATTDANGNFSLVTTASSLGNLTAIVTDVWGVQSSPRGATLTVQPPQLGRLNAINLGNGEWEFIGTVTGPDVADDKVQLSGLASASVAPDANGSFSAVVYIGGHPCGTEYAVATDVWGQTSNQVTYTFIG
jgi:hypothetical protein